MENSDIQITINDIKELSYSLDSKLVPSESIELGKNFNLGIGFRFVPDLENEVFQFSTMVNYIGENIEKPFLDLQTEITFKVKNIKQVVQEQENNSFTIDDAFLETIAGICIGTTRGILATKIAGSIIAGLHLPVINPREILAEMKKSIVT